MERLTEINKYSDLLIKSLNDREKLIEALKARGEITQALSLAEQIQSYEVDQISNIVYKKINKKSNKMIPIRSTSGNIFTIPAMAVDTFSVVDTTQAVLSYIPSSDHFAIKIAGRLLHGNIGQCLTKDKELKKVKNCKFTSCKKQDCMFYHDPLLYGGNDCRNFTHHSGQQIGLNNLEEIHNLTPEDLSRMSNKLMHDLLVYLLAVKIKGG